MIGTVSVGGKACAPGFWGQERYRFVPAMSRRIVRAVAATPDCYYEFDHHDTCEQADCDADWRRYAGGDIFEHQAQAFAADMSNERADEDGEQYEEELVGHRSHSELR